MSDDRPTPRPFSSHDEATRGWARRAAAVVSGLLLALGLSGLWIYFAGFSIFGQFLVLAHTALGLVLLIFYPSYQWTHLRVWIRQRLTASMVLGYTLLATVVVSIASGLWLTWQAGFGSRISELWDLVHLVSGIAALALIAAHIVAAVIRRRTAARRDPELRVAISAFARRTAWGLGLTTTVAVAAAVAWPHTDYSMPIPDGYTLPSFAQEFDEYRDNPFAPTYARTEDLQLVKSELLAGSRSCGTANCHQQILEEWEPSAHRFAAMNPPFQEVQRRFAAEREAAETRYCAGCHDPISLFAGAKDLHAQSLSAPGMDEGISCVACHSISLVDQRGNADYVLTPPAKYLGEGADGLAKWISDFLIRAYPRQHLLDYDRNLLRTPEYCGACHKQFIPEALNRFGLVEGQNQYDEWKNGHWHSDDPETDLTCTDCHMRLVSESADPGHGESADLRRSADDGAHRHHGFIATNNFMPAVLRLPHWERQVELTEEWMRGETVLPEIDHIWPRGPVAGLQLQAPDIATPGDDLDILVAVSNRKAGHNFITGPLDFVRSWIHLRILSEAGEVLAEWGTINPETRRIEDQPGVAHDIGNPRDRGTLVLEAIPIDDQGQELRQHELWRKAGGKGKRVIFPQYTDAHSYRLRLPEGLSGELTLVAELNYRRYRQEFLDLVLPGLEERTGAYQPVVTQARAARKVRLTGGPASEASSGEAGR